MENLFEERYEIYETSSKTGENVETVIRKIAEAMPTTKEFLYHEVAVPRNPEVIPIDNQKKKQKQRCINCA